MPHTAATLQAAFGYLFPDEVTALQDLAKMLPDEPVVVNIGAGAGTSGLAFLEARDDLILHTVDTQNEDSPFGCLAAEEQVLREAGLWKLPSISTWFKERNYQHWGDSKKMGDNLSGILNGEGFYWPKYEGQIQDKVDMVFIDGDHSYEGCSGDIIAWLPNIKPGGILAIHDYDKAAVYERGNLPAVVPHPKPWPGVDRAVNEIIEVGYEVILQVDTLIAFKVGK